MYPQARRPGSLAGRRAEAGQADRLRPVEAQGVQAEHFDRVRAQPQLLQKGLPYFDGMIFTIVRDYNRAAWRRCRWARPIPPRGRPSDRTGTGRPDADAAGDQGPREGRLHSRGRPDLSGPPHEQAALSGRASQAGGLPGHRPARADEDRAVRGAVRLLRLGRHVPAATRAARSSSPRRISRRPRGGGDPGTRISPRPRRCWRRPATQTASRPL